MSDWRDAIRAVAARLGFQQTGVAPADTVLPNAAFLREWLGRGCHGDMAYLQKGCETRQDIRRWYAPAQSVIVVAHNYYQADSRGERPECGNIARYAWGRDYHKVVGKKLQSLLVSLQRLDPRVEGKWCVDSAPVAEKQWAVAAGIGWQGKHSLVISPQLGSWLFLGVLAINRALPGDPLLPDRCGTCTACLTACPTGAIVAPHVVDARRCLAYLTIEQREMPHRECLPVQAGNWVFGCDICQDVCPWNRKLAKPTSEPDYRPRPGMVRPLLRELAEMSETEFAARFAGTPVMRAKWQNFIGNVRRAMGQRKGT